MCTGPAFLGHAVYQSFHRLRALQMADVINCQFREFAAALLGPVHFLSPDQQSGIHCLIIRGIQLLTPNNFFLGGRGG